jgi:hypothetical protein
VLHQLINKHFDKEQAAKYMAVVDAQGEEECRHAFDPIKMMCAFGDLLGNTPEEKTSFKKRIIGTIPGIDFPDDFDKLPEEERERRINGVLGVL